MGDSPCIRSRSLNEEKDRLVFLRTPAPLRMWGKGLGRFLWVPWGVSDIAGSVLTTTILSCQAAGVAPSQWRRLGVLTQLPTPRGKEQKFRFQERLDRAKKYKKKIK